MNFCSVPYEADFGMSAEANKMMNISGQMGMQQNGPQGQGQGQGGQGCLPSGGMPMSMASMGLNQSQMQLPPMTTGQMSYPMQGSGMQSLPLGMMPPGNAMPLGTMSSNLPIGAVTPLNSMTMLPMMGNAMGSIDAPGVNAVLSGLQPMSGMQPIGGMQPMGGMPQMSQMPPMQQFTQMPQMQHEGRLSGGGGAAGNWSCSNANCQPMASNTSTWQYGGSPSQQLQQHQMHQMHHQQQQHQQNHHHHQQQQQQAQQNQQRMKSHYDTMMSNNYRDVRNGLNSPAMLSLRDKGNNSFNSSKNLNKVWR